jgi:ribonucleoside-diphosphate reductase alpha chain
MKDIIDMSRHRGYFVDQSQSLNLFMCKLFKIDINAFFMHGSGLNWYFENKGGS